MFIVNFWGGGYPLHFLSNSPVVGRFGTDGRGDRLGNMVEARPLMCSAGGLIGVPQLARVAKQFNSFLVAAGGAESNIFVVL